MAADPTNSNPLVEKHELPASASDTYIGTEESVKTSSVRKVVLGEEPLRAGYPPRLAVVDGAGAVVAFGMGRGGQ